MDEVIKTAEQIKDEALKRMDFLGLPEWVKREYKENDMVCYCDQFLGTSLTVDQSEEVEQDISMLTKPEAFGQKEYGIPLLAPYYAVCTEGPTIVLAVERAVVVSSWNQWSMAQKQLKDGWVSSWIVRNGKIANGFVGFPLKWETHRSGIKLIMPTEEELAEKHIVVR